MLLAEGLIVVWKKVHLYNSLMSLMAGVGFMTIWKLIKDLQNEVTAKAKIWSINFAIIGVIIFVCGMYMTLTWSLSPYYALDNIIFGEPNFVFGAILLGLVVYFWSHNYQIESSSQPLSYFAGDIFSFNISFMRQGLLLFH